MSFKPSLSTLKWYPPEVQNLTFIYSQFFLCVKMSIFTAFNVPPVLTLADWREADFQNTWFCGNVNIQAGWVTKPGSSPLKCWIELNSMLCACHTQHSTREIFFNEPGFVYSVWFSEWLTLCSVNIQGLISLMYNGLWFGTLYCQVYQNSVSLRLDKPSMAH